MKPWLLLATILLVASCTTASPVSSSMESEPRVCFNSKQIRSFDALSDSHVYVRENRDKHYLLTTRTRCLDLRSATGIAISNTTNRVCSGGFGKIIYRHSLGSTRGPELCSIKMIENVSSKEHARAIVEARTGPPDKEEQATWTEQPVED